MSRLTRLIVGGLARNEAELAVSLSRRAVGIVRAARVHPAFVVVDTAPMGQVGDALYVTPSADRILLVARLGNTDREALKHVRELLDQSSLEASGLLLIEPMAAAERYAYALESERQIFLRSAFGAHGRVPSETRRRSGRPSAERCCSAGRCSARGSG